MELFNPNIKKFSEKSFSYISGNETFFKKILIFQEGTFQAQKIKKPKFSKILRFCGHNKTLRFYGET